MPQFESPNPETRPTDDPPTSRSQTEQVPPDTFFELLDDEYVQQILERIKTTAKSGRELAESCDASRATVYRRLNRLEEVGWVETSMALGRDGHHRTLYQSTLDRVQIDLDDDGFRTEATTSTTHQ